MIRKATAAALLLLGGAAGHATGQTPERSHEASAAAQAPEPREHVAPCAEPIELISDGLNDPLQDLARSAELRDPGSLRSRTVRRSSSELRLSACPSAPAYRPTALGGPFQPGSFEAGPVVRMLPVGMTAQLNSGYPRGGNNGARWAGRGVSTDVRGGAAASWGPFTAVLAPVVAFHENRHFETIRVNRIGHSEFAYPWHNGIDWPQRFGDDAFWTLHPGQSVVRVDLRGFAAGVATENLWWGPAIRNPIIMSNNAPGMPHFFIGTGRPHDIWIGNLELEAVWGRPKTSDYHLLEARDERVMFAGVVLTLEPRGVPGLYLGIARSYMENFPPGELSLWEQITRPYRGLGENIGVRADFGDNQIGSVFARWALPASGFEAYVEWAREDHWSTRQHLIMEPDHSRGYTAGLQKVLPVGDADRSLRIQGEVTHLGTSATRQSTGEAVTFYRHSQVRQGYTHRGQILGTWIGPGSDAQFLGFDLLDPRGRLGFYLERIRYDADAYYNRWAQWYDFQRHDVELTGGLRGAWASSEFTVTSELTFSRRYNRNFLELDGFNWHQEIDTNWGLQVGLSWRRMVPQPPAARTGEATP